MNANEIITTFVVFVLFALACLAVALAIVALPLVFRQLRYRHQGRALNEWLRDFDTLLDKMGDDLSAPMPSMEDLLAEPKEPSERAGAAVRAMGPRCLPWLKRMLNLGRQPGVEGSFLGGRHLEIIRWQHAWPWLKPEFATHDQLQRRALSALAELGPEAAPLALDVRTVLTREGCSMSAGQTLVAMGEVGIKILRELLDHPDSWTRFAAALSLTPLAQERTHHLARVLLALLSEGVEVQVFAVAMCLNRFSDHQDEIATGLLDALKSKNSAVRAAIISAMGAFRSMRARLLPALTQLAESDPEASIRMAAREVVEALKQEPPTGSNAE